MATKKAAPARRYKSECYAVAIDDTWFLGRTGWVDEPSFASKYAKGDKANADALDVERLHPGKRVRVVRLIATWTVKGLS